MESSPLWLSLYAAAVATGVLVWNIKNEFFRRGTHLKLRPLRVTFFNHPGLKSDAEPVLMVRVFNDSEHKVKIIGWGLESQKSSQRLAMLPDPILLKMPLEVEAKDGGELWVPESVAAKAGLDLSKPIMAWCQTSNGLEFKTKNVILEPDLPSKE